MCSKNCIICNKIIIKKKLESSNYFSTKKYCSNECSALARKGGNHPNWKGGRPIVKCRNCNKEFIGRFGKAKSIFCSKSCNGSYNGKGNKYALNLSPPNKGIKMPEDQIEKLRKAKLGKKGKESNAWKGGLTSANNIIRSSLEYKDWRKSVFERDNYTCQFCNQVGGKLNADHIKPFALFPDLRLDIDNGRTLCKDCHRKTDTFGGKTKVCKSKILI